MPKAGTLLILGSLAFSLLFLEGALRFTSYVSLLPYDSIPRGYYIADSDLGYDIAPNVAGSLHTFRDASYPIWSNELGCFDLPYRGERPYVFLTGDSFAWGFAPFEAKWGTVLEEILRQRVVKCGVAGFGTRQELAKAAKVLATIGPPQNIIVSYFANDLEDDATFPNRAVYEGSLINNLSGDPTTTYESLRARLPQYAAWAEEYCMWSEPRHPTLQRLKCVLRRHSIVYVVTQNAVKQLLPPSILRAAGVVNDLSPRIELDKGTVERHLGYLADFHALARKDGADLLVVLIPRVEDVAAVTPSTTYTAVRTFCDEQGIAYYDPLPEFQLRKGTIPLYWKHDSHLSTAGNRLLGLLVARRVLWMRGGPSERIQGVEEQLSQNWSF